ncbi:MAG TPA: hypothetical protein HPP56_08080 [Nitrospirae bacterium]|nr:hypothetical protein [Nitrospirota bacterium]
MQNNWDKSFKKISIWAVYIIAPLSLIALFLFNWKASLSLILGGFFAIVNFRGVIWGVENIVALDKSKSKMMIMTLFRLLVIFSLLLILLIFGVINIPAIAAGFSIVFLLILKEGLVRAKEMREIEDA